MRTKREQAAGEVIQGPWETLDGGPPDSFEALTTSSTSESWRCLCRRRASVVAVPPERCADQWEGEDDRDRDAEERRGAGAARTGSSGMRKRE
jgi:hypothetical protein